MVLAAGALVALIGWLSWSALEAIDYRHRKDTEAVAVRNELVGLAREIKGQGDAILRVATTIDDATSQQARDRSAATLANAIADLRRSIDCAALYTMEEYPPPCAGADGRLDALRAGIDPFARPSG